MKSYLKSIGSLHKGLFNPNGRAYPDIAAQGDRFAVVLNGTADAFRGTSVSSPVAAGGMSISLGVNLIMC